MSTSLSDSALHVAVIGAGGYVGGELLRILAKHPAVAKITACSDSNADGTIAAVHPNLTGSLELKFVAVAEVTQADVVFFATPARVACTQAAKFLDAGSVVVDCSPDFRLQDLDTWAKWYGGEHPQPDLVTKAVYGLVEHNRDQLADAKLIAAPGCYATAIQLASIPVAKAMGDLEIIVAAASGTSGAGKKVAKSQLLLAEAGNNYSAYAVSGHRHGPEILQGLAEYAGVTAKLRFIPHLLAVPRGMFATVYFVAEKQLDLADILHQAYAAEVFGSVLAPETSPQLSHVLNSNRFVVGSSQSQQAVMCAIDNLGKGAAGQAVQAMNIACGCAETAGLT